MNTHWEVRLTYTLEVPDTSCRLTLVKRTLSLLHVQSLHYSLDTTGRWLHGETGTVLRTYAMNWSQTVTCCL